jgi:streptomycin 6-kinase
VFEIPASFRAMPRWWSDGTGWLDALPGLVQQQCERWELRRDGPLRHGSNALVIPVRRGGEALALRLTPPGPDVEATAAALRFWAGRGTVLLTDADPGRGALLLERLDATRCVADLPPEQAMPILGRAMRRLAVPAPPAIPSTGEVIAAEASGWTDRWAALGEPIDRRLLAVALTCADVLREPHTPGLAVNADLHDGQVLAGSREPWLVVDPVLLRGDIGYDLGRILWHRVEDLGDDSEIRRWLSVLTDAAGLGADRARRWVVARAMSYLLWGLEHRLTEDPPRCRRLLAVFAA